MSSAWIVLGLGSSLGDRRNFLRRAIRALAYEGEEPVLKNIRLSPLYESDALLPEGAPESWNVPYLNMAIAGETSLDSDRLLKSIKEIEARLGRQKRERWSPREIDIDILAWGPMAKREDHLKIPHLGLLDRPFALWPLADVLPDWEYPLAGPDQGRTARELSGRWGFGPEARIPCNTRRAHSFATEIVGILNITPDSFSGDGVLGKSDEILVQARKLIEGGASVLDIGAESTRPGAVAIEPEEEWRRLLPVLDQLVRADLPSTVRLSVDTRHPEVAARALEMGVDWINDVTGFTDPRMRECVRESDTDLVFMHSLSIPPRRELVIPSDKNPVDALLIWAESQIDLFESEGFLRERMIFDPGIGFGKTPAQAFEILRNVGRFRELGVRVLIGHSRKSFLSLLTQKPFSDRDLETALVSGFLARQGMDYLRVHNPGLNSMALKISGELDGVFL
jgi:2-amino-4-hydroxy-6-hydroxymethyldihydropteridine diphosphokinase/dihydropteroate synthase